MADLIDRQATVDRLKKERSFFKSSEQIGIGLDIARMIIEERVQSAQPEIVRCKDCKWWEKQEDSPLGYCNAVKHCHYSRHWEIQIYRRYEPDFFCADGERRSEDE